MNRFDLPYVALTTAVGLALFCAGRWSAPSEHAHVVYVPDAPVVQAVNEPLIPPPPPVESVRQPPVVSSPAPVVSVRYVAAPVVPTPSAQAPKPPPPPEVIVLEEIPDNPYRAQK